MKLNVLRVWGMCAGLLSLGAASAFAQTAYDSIESEGMRFGTGADLGSITERMRITQDGKVGVGITTPTANFQVSGTFIVSLSAQTTSPSLYIDSDGLVGIGTASPASGAKLDVSGTLYSRVFNAGSSTTIDWSYGNVQYTSASCGSFTLSSMLDGAIYVLVIKGTLSATCSFTHAGLTFDMPADHGATTAGTATTYTFLRAGTDVYVAWTNGASGSGGATVAGSTGDIQFNSSGALDSDTGQLFWDKASNYLGIGTGAPSAALHVVGDVKYSGMITDISDKRAKTDIKDLPRDTLDRLMLLRPVSFRMREGDGSQEFGFIAQEVQPHFPELVRDGDVLSLNYVGLIAPMAKSIQMLNAKLKEQHVDTAALRQEITALLKTVGALQREVRRLKGDSDGE